MTETFNKRLSGSNMMKLCVISFVVLALSACSGVATKSQLDELSPSDSSVSQMPENQKLIDDISMNEYQQAIDLMDQGKLDDADKLLIKVVDKHPDLAAPLYNLGVISEAKDDLAGAAVFYNRALEADKHYYLAYNNLGIIARTQGKFEQALNYYSDGLKEAPHSLELHYNMAVLNEIYLHDYAKAIEHYERYLALHEQNNTGENTKNVTSWVKALKRRSR